MDFIIGLDFRGPVRVVCLKALPGQRFLVTHCEMIDNLSQYSFDASRLINIALPDIQVFNKTVTEKDENNAEIVWDRRDELMIITSREKRDKVLALFQARQMTIHAIDIESEAIARALRVLCEVTDLYMAILNYDLNHQKLYLSIFKGHRKIFFHQESMPGYSPDDIDNIITRAFKLFEIRYSGDIKILPSQCYIIGKHPEEMTKWGVEPKLMQKLDFELEAAQEEFKKDPAQWLLACGLSLWDKKSSWNLMPWRESDHRKERKILFKQMLKAILYGFSVLILAHGVILWALHFQDEHNSSLDEKIQKLNTQAQAVNQVNQEINTLQLHIKSLKQFSDDQLVAIGFLNDLSRSMPDGVFLNSLTLEQYKVSIGGRAETKAQIDILLNTLKQHAGWAQVILKNTAQDESSPPYHFDFNIQLVLNGVKSK